MQLNREEKILKYFQSKNELFIFGVVLLLSLGLFVDSYYLFFKNNKTLTDIIVIVLVSAALVVTIYLVITNKRRYVLSDSEYKNIVEEDLNKIYEQNLLKIKQSDIILSPIIRKSPCLYKGSKSINFKYRKKIKSLVYSHSKYTFLVFLKDNLFFSEYHVNHITGSSAFYKNRYIYYKDILGYGYRSDIVYNNEVSHDVIQYHISLQNKEDFIFDIRDDVAYKNKYKISFLYNLYLKDQLYIFMSIEIVIFILLWGFLMLVLQTTVFITIISLLIYCSNIIGFCFLKQNVSNNYEPINLSKEEKDIIVAINETITRQKANQV